MKIYLRILKIYERYENIEISSLEEFKEGLIEKISKNGAGAAHLGTGKFHDK